MELLIVAVLIGLLPAFIASRRGRNFFLWWMFGAALFIVALPCALLLRSDRVTLDDRAYDDGLRPCRHCREYIRPDATVCRYCGRDL